VKLSNVLKALTVLIVLAGTPAFPQTQSQPGVSPVLKTPLRQDILDLLANEISGQMAFNNEVRLAGAPWLREESEFTGTMAEARQILDLARSYGVDTARLERYPAGGTFDYPQEGELWIIEPATRLLARFGADPALVAGGSVTADITGELVYIPPLSQDEIKAMAAAGPQEKYRGKLALMWSHARGDLANALDVAGIRGVISFSAQERYLDPDQVIYASGSYADHTNLKLGMTVSWRQWTNLWEDLEGKQKIVLRAKTRIEKYPGKFEMVYSWIPGTEPDAKGVIFTGHLFEGYTKRGANDDISGCVVQLEILRALTKLIASGQLPKPRRTIHFLWPNEISGTYEFIKQHPGFADKLSININMDMVGEALRKNNAVFTMSECPAHLPSYLDGLAGSLLNYVWRTNDIVYLPDAPRGRPRGQFFPAPMVEKSGSGDAFRFFIHRATGGSDHICFNNPSVAVPGIEFFVWPDQWYHTDHDTPDKGDSTEMKRVAFIGAAAAWAAADCSDEVLPGLADAVSEFGYSRIAERDIPRAMANVERTDAKALAAAMARSLSVADAGVQREIGALRSIADMYTGTAVAQKTLANRIQQWELYRAGLRAQVVGYARIKAAELGIEAPPPPAASALEKKYQAVVPALARPVRGQLFQLSAHEPYTRYVKEHPEALKATGLSTQQAAVVLNYVNGKRSVTEVRAAAAGELNEEISLENVISYLELLGTVQWIEFR
jgi:aminopeptidase YwaD